MTGNYVKFAKSLSSKAAIVAGCCVAALTVAVPASADPSLTKPSHAISISNIELSDEVTCLAQNIYFEARSEPVAGMLAVGHVVLNRVASKRFPNTICKVVRQGGEQRKHVEVRVGPGHHPIAVPDAILLKNGRLTEHEMDVMKGHPVIGERICAGLKSFRLVLPIIRHHHEKCNGTGYPDGLVGDQIPLPSRVMTVCDIYDALTAMDRPYKRALSTEDALRILEKEATAELLDEDIVRIFIESDVYLRNTAFG